MATMLKDNLVAATKLAVKKSPLHRYGVFAAAPIERFEIIEEAPYFCVANEDVGESFEAYCYDFNDTHRIIGCGYASLYNHSYKPSASHQVDVVNGILRHYALRDILPDEEITINYGEENAKEFLKEDK
jgi:SET domain-containing protein